MDAMEITYTVLAVLAVSFYIFLNTKPGKKWKAML